MDEFGETIELLQYRYFFCNQNKANDNLLSNFLYEKGCLKNLMDKYKPELIVIGVSCINSTFIYEKICDIDVELNSSIKIFNI